MLNIDNGSCMPELATKACRQFCLYSFMYLLFRSSDFDQQWAIHYCCGRQGEYNCTGRAKFIPGRPWLGHHLLTTARLPFTDNMTWYPASSIVVALALGCIIWLLIPQLGLINLRLLTYYVCSISNHHHHWVMSRSLAQKLFCSSLYVSTLGLCGFTFFRFWFFGFQRWKTGFPVLFQFYILMLNFNCWS